MRVSRWLTWTPPSSQIIEKKTNPNPQNLQNTILRVLQVTIWRHFRRLGLSNKATPSRGHSLTAHVAPATPCTAGTTSAITNAKPAG